MKKHVSNNIILCYKTHTPGALFCYCKLDIPFTHILKLMGREKISGNLCNTFGFFWLFCFFGLLTQIAVDKRIKIWKISSHLKPHKLAFKRFAFYNFSSTPKTGIFQAFCKSIGQPFYNLFAFWTSTQRHADKKTLEM